MTLLWDGIGVLSCLVFSGYVLFLVRDHYAGRYRKTLRHIDEMERDLFPQWFEHELPPTNYRQVFRLPFPRLPSGTRTQLEQAERAQWAILHRQKMQALGLYGSGATKHDWLEDEVKTVILPSGERISEEERVRRGL